MNFEWERIIAMYPISLTCTPIMPEHSRKYSGNNLLCNVPKTLLGRFLNMVMPATNVVYATVPNQIENDRRWTDAAAWGGRRGWHFPANLRRASFADAAPAGTAAAEEEPWYIAKRRAHRIDTERKREELCGAGRMNNGPSSSPSPSPVATTLGVKKRREEEVDANANADAVATPSRRSRRRG